MAQPPWQVDQLQIEPGSGDTITIDRDPSTGSLRFIDALLPGGVDLQALVGARTIAGVYIVGRSGDGAAYTTIQSALDAIPDGSSAAEPSLVLVYPGLYQEALSVQKDGVFLVGLGGVTVTNPAGTPGATVTIEEGVTTTPTRAVLSNLKITNAEAGHACVRMVGSVASTVGSGSLALKGCDLVALGVGAYQIDADTVNHVEVHGGSWAGSSSTSICRVRQCATFQMHGVCHVNDLELAYDTGNDQPVVTTSQYLVSQVGRIRDILVSLQGAGSLTLSACPNVGDVTLAGDRSALLSSCNIGDLTVGGTAAVVRVGGSRGTASGTGSLSEAVFTGSVEFAGSLAETVVFEVAQPDTEYVVLVDSPVAGNIPQATVKSVADFTLTAPAALTGTVQYAVMRKA